MIETLFEKDLLKVELPPQSSDSIDDFILEYTENFGSHEEIPLTIQGVKDLTKYIPSARVVDSGVFVDFYMSLHVKNPF